jgi:RNA-binding protein 42
MYRHDDGPVPPPMGYAEALGNDYLVRREKRQCIGSEKPAMRPVQLDNGATTLTALWWQGDMNKRQRTQYEHSHGNSSSSSNDVTIKSEKQNLSPSSSSSLSSSSSSLGFSSGSSRRAKHVDATLEQWPESDFRLLVQKLAPSVTSEMLAERFSVYRSFSMARVIVDKSTGESRGFGFVSMLDMDDFRRAISEMTGRLIQGRAIVVKRAKINK